MCPAHDLIGYPVGACSCGIPDQLPYTDLIQIGFGVGCTLEDFYPGKIMIPVFVSRVDSYLYADCS